MPITSQRLVNGQQVGFFDRLRQRFQGTSNSEGPTITVRASDPDFLNELLKQQGAVQNQPPAQPAEVAAPREEVRPRKRRSSSSPVGQAVGYLAAMAIGTVLWAVDGYYTLVALQALGLPIEASLDWPWLLSNAALLAWIIPLVVEAIEQVLLGEKGILFWVFVGVSLVNMVATGYGLWVEFAGELGEGTRTLWVLSVLGGVLLAFGPGRVIIEAVKACVKLVR